MIVIYEKSVETFSLIQVAHPSGISSNSFILEHLLNVASQAFPHPSPLTPHPK